MFARDEFFIAQVADFDRFSLGPWMAFGHRHNHLVVPDLFESEPAVIALKTDKPDFDFPFEQIADDTGGVADAQDRFDLRILLGELAQFLQQQILAGNAAAADPKLAAKRAMKLFHRGDGFALKRE